MVTVPYDEFGMFHENLAEWGLDVPIPLVVRRGYDVGDGRQLSALLWSNPPYHLALVHGSAQNAHTFDTVALALQRPLVSVDLPGHGHSDPSPFGAPIAASHAKDVATALRQVVTAPITLVGMSLGGMTSLIVARDNPDLVGKLVMVDITPGVTPEKSKHIFEFVNGPSTFDDFDSLLARTKEHNPTRSESSLRRGILHNALQRDDGSWVWRHQRHPRSETPGPETGDLWQAISDLSQPIMLVRGMAKGSVVDDADEAEFKRRRPDAVIVHVEGAGHSVQGDRPLDLANAISGFC